MPKDQADKKDSDDSNGFKSRNAEVDFYGQKRSNDTHASATDPEARLYKKSAGQEARLAHLGHVLTDNRQGLVLAADISMAHGQAERSTALAMLDQRKQDHGI